jgi:hypothetical protein
MKKPPEIIYNELKSFYTLDFVGSLNNLSMGTNYLTDPGREKGTDEEVLGYIRDSLETIKEQYDSISPDMLEQRHFKEIRKINGLIPGLEKHVRYITENYNNTDVSSGRMKRKNESVYRRTKKISVISNKWRERINRIGEEIGIGKDIGKSLMDEKYPEDI